MAHSLQQQGVLKPTRFFYQLKIDINTYRYRYVFTMSSPYAVILLSASSLQNLPTIPFNLINSIGKEKRTI